MCVLLKFGCPTPRALLLAKGSGRLPLGRTCMRWWPFVLSVATRDGFWIMALIPPVLIGGVRILHTAFEAATAICTLFHIPEVLNIIVRF